MERYSQRILTHLADQRYRPRELRELARDLQIPEEDVDAFAANVRLLAENGQVLLGAADTVALPPPGREMEGVFRRNPRGFGFIVPDSPTEHGDLFVPPDRTADAMNGDRVRARVIHEKGRAGGGRSPYIGQILEVLQRADKHFVGNLLKDRGRWVVQVDGKQFTDPVLVRDPHAKGAREGNKVVVELIAYPSDDEPAEGVITEVLGEAGQPDVETAGVMRAYGLPERFDPEVVEEARQAAGGFDDQAIPANREDFTGVFICTIDPPDARDFDDAINLRRLDPLTEPDGAAYELGVHIADVASFVRPGGALDQEAYQRGNSTYLPQRVIPMLPELLSNGVCSLQEGVNRHTKSAIVRYDREGQVVGQRLTRSVIRSAKRLTYLEAQALIDGDIKEARKHARTDPKYSRELIETLQLADELAKVIRRRRLRDGMIVLGLPEVELIFDESGRVVDAQPEDTAFTHTLIEMFMVEANECAARLFDLLDVPMIRRVHPDPDAHDVSELRQFARVAGFNIPMRPTRKELQTLLDAVRGKPAQQAVHFAVLKTLSKAEYAPLLVGHYALASEHYTHFTSPIRRYADLVVHRALEAYFDAYPDHRRRYAPSRRDRETVVRALFEDPRCPNLEALQEIGKHCSTTERNSEQAERDLRTYLVMELLAESHLGEDFAGTVTGVTGSGIFVQIDRFLVDGFVRTADLPSAGAREDRWKLNRRTGALVAERSGRTIQIGDRFTVRIAKVVPATRSLDLVIIETPAEGKKKKKASGEGGKPKPRRQPAGARKAHKETMGLKSKKNKRRGK